MNMKALFFSCASLLIGAVVTSTAHAQGGELALRSGDRITISIGAIPDNEVVQIKGIYTIGDNGTVNLLHIGEVRAAGVKPSSLQKIIEQTYIAREIYTRPNVLVSIDGGGDATSRPIYVVSGALKNGPVPYKQGMTLMQAISAAGGPSPFASMRRVKLIRTSVNGQRSTTEHNLSKYSNDPSVDTLLQPEDQIILPE